MKSFAAVFLLLLSPTLSWATTFTVCSSGCNSATIAGIFSAIDLAPGDVVEVQADTLGGAKTYNETIKPGADDGGALGNPVVVKARTGDHITISGSNYCVDTRTNLVQYITIDGFTCNNTSSYTMYLGGGGSSSSSSPSAYGVTIQNCTINGNQLQGMYFNACGNCIARNNTVLTADGSYSSQSDGIISYRGAGNVFENNHVEIRNDHNSPHVDCFQTAWESNLTIRNNYCDQNNTSTANKQHIITQYNEGWTRIYNNVLYKGSGSTGSNAINADGANFYIYNNSLDLSGANSGIALTSTGDLYIQNNAIKIGNSAVAIWVETSVSVANIHHNLVSTGTSSPWRQGSTTYNLAGWKALGGGTGSVTGTPGWDANHRPSGGSSNLVDAGVSLSSLFTTDKDGISRPQGSAWDIGAYEYLSGYIPPPPTPPILIFIGGTSLPELIGNEFEKNVEG